jgi:polyphosphate kinase 2
MTSAQNYRWVALPSAEGSIRCGCTRSSPTRRERVVFANPTGARHEQFAEARHREKELLRLQTELVAMTEWVKQSGTRVVAIFEGRDAAGKGGSIKRIAQLVSPRICRIVALPAPTERERTQWYFQRYVSNLPSGGEIMLFDRSWYNRAGVERVMGFCTDEQYERFLSQVPTFERMLVNDGIILLKYWFSVSDDEQQRRFRGAWRTPPSNGAQPDGSGIHRALHGLLLASQDVMFSVRTFRRLAGTSSSPTTRRRPGSTASRTCSPRYPMPGSSYRR